MLGQTRSFGYEYDEAGRLVAVTVDGAQHASYTYDANGNRLSATVDGVTTTAEYDAQDRLRRYGDTTYTYTESGELVTKSTGAGTTEYDYDIRGNLRSVSLPDGTDIEYVIDGRDRRIGKRVDGELVQGFLYKDQLNPVAELDGDGEVVSRFIYAEMAHSPSYMIRDGVAYRIITDHLGSPRVVANARTGEVVQVMEYDAFGNLIRDTNPGFQPFGFAGGLYDRDTGLVRFGARDYDPETGRWTAKDPILFVGGDTSLYGYASSDPINFSDPSGLFVGTAIARGLGALRGLTAEEAVIQGKGYDLLAGVAAERSGLGPEGGLLGDVALGAEFVGGLQGLGLGYSVYAARGAEAAALMFSGLGGYTLGSAINDLYERQYGKPLGLAGYDWLMRKLGPCYRY